MHALKLWPVSRARPFSRERSVSFRPIRVTGSITELSRQPTLTQRLARQLRAQVGRCGARRHRSNADMWRVAARTLHGRD